MKRLCWRVFQDWAAVIYFASRLNFALFCVASEKKVAIEFFFIPIIFSYIYSQIPHTHVLHAPNDTHEHAHGASVVGASAHQAQRGERWDRGGAASKSYCKCIAILKHCNNATTARNPTELQAPVQQMRLHCPARMGKAR